MGETPGLTAQFARFAADTQYEDLPREVTAQARKSLLDHLGAALGGSRQPAATALWGLAREMGGPPEATLIGSTERASRFWAAAVNGSVAHTLELDDGHVIAHGHPGVAIIPAVFAAAETQNIDGRALLTAIVLGYEVNLRVGDGITPEAQYDRGHHSAALVGSLGASAAVGRLLGLDAKQIAGALGNCCLGPTAPFEAFRSGSAVKDFYGGWPAAVGLFAAVLAQRGIEGPHNFLEARRGLLNCVSRSWDAARILRGLGEHWWNLGVYYKKHAACSLSFTAIDAALELARLPQPVDEIEAIEVRTHIFAHELDDPAPTTVQGAKFSIPYVIACALLRRRVFLEEFLPDVIADMRVRELAQRVSVVLDDEYTALHTEREDRRPSTVQIRFRNGQVVEETRDIPRGCPEDPLSDDEFRAKYQFLAEMAVSTERADEIWETVLHLEQLTNIGELLSLLRPEPGRPAAGIR